MSNPYLSHLSSYPCIIILFLLTLNINYTKANDPSAAEGSGSSPRLDFSAGAYRNILVAIDPALDRNQCPDIISEIRNTLQETSSKLYSATDQLVYFESVKILIPVGWGAFCQSAVNNASAGDSYEIADIKICDNNPQAKSLPWTRQYKGCGQGADDIFIPTEFLLSPLSRGVKSNILLHEWAKFRYGVFEEYGYFEDGYNGCYIREGSLHFTSCSNGQLGALVASNNSSANCKAEVDSKMDTLTTQLKTGSSSLMSMPHFENMATFCTNTTHNRFSSTRQNALCDGQSTREVIDIHPDFLSIGSSNSNSSQIREFRNTTFEIIHHIIDPIDPAYLFLIEDSTVIRSKMRYIKQAISQIVDLLPFTSTAALAIGLTNPAVARRLSTIEMKTGFVNLIPDSVSQSSQNETSQEQRQDQVNNNIYSILNQALGLFPELNIMQKWHIVLVTNLPSISIQEGRTRLHESRSGATLSVLTFEENNPAWLRMYTTPKTKNIIVFPNCQNINSFTCSKAANLAVDDFVDTMSVQSVPKYFSKVVDVQVNPGVQSVVNINQSMDGVTNFYFYVTIFTPNVELVQIRNPGGVPCHVQLLLGYNYVAVVNTCPFQTGNWTINLQGLPATDPISAVSAFVEVTQSAESSPVLRVRSSLGVGKEREVDPNNQLVPVFARVTDPFDRPVIEATVQLSTFTSSPSNQPLQTIPLFDNGLDPDLTSNDGIYSGYLKDFSPNPGYHSSQLVVTPQPSKTRIITSLSPNSSSPALLDPFMSTKCCGSSLSPQTSINLSPFSYTTVLLGYKTSQNFNPSLLPPARIQGIQVTEDDGQTLTLKFISPASIFTLSHYESCCTYTNATVESEQSCFAILSPSDCTPVGPGLVQMCHLSRNEMAKNHIGNGTTPTAPDGQSLKIYFNCKLGGVTSQGVKGKLSIASVEITVELQDRNGGGEGRNSECKSVKDGCLPIAVFWGLIGCIGGLVLVLLVLIICWCVVSRRNKSREKTQKTKGQLGSNYDKNGEYRDQHQTDYRNDGNRISISEPQATNPRQNPNANPVSKSISLPEKESPLYNVYVNKAYIQDVDGQMKMVASDGELLPLEPPQYSPKNKYDQSSSRPGSVGVNRQGQDQGRDGHVSRSRPQLEQYEQPPVRRRSIDAASPPRPRPQPIHIDMDDTRDMQIYKSHLSQLPSGRNGPGPAPAPPPKPGRFGSNDNLEEASAPVPRNRFPRGDSGYANSDPRFPIPPNTDLVHSQPASKNKPTMTPLKPVQTEEYGVDVDVPIYASVNRNRRTLPRSNSNNAIPIQPIGSLINITNPNTFKTFQGTRPKSFDEDNDKPASNNTFPIKNRFTNPNKSSNRPALLTGINTTNNASRPTPTPTSQSVSATTNGFGQNRPTSRLDLFPSSDSESYSDMSRGLPSYPTPPPAPPPFPTASNGYGKSLVTIPGSGEPFIRDTPLRQNLPNVRKPPRSTNTNNANAMVHTSPPHQPPPPPPRRSSSLNNNANDSHSEDYDDDSDNWDDDDFGQPGVSYA